jgi:hypothetical protein
MEINMLVCGMKIKNMEISHFIAAKVRNNKFGKEDALKIKLSA